MVVVMSASVASFQIRGVLVHIVDLRLLVDGVWWVFGDNVPRVNQSWEVTKDTKQNVDKRVCGANTSSNPDRKWGEKHGNDHETNVGHALTAAATHC